jgi:hypothetical protein
MAIVKNFWLKNQSKKLAGAVIYQAMGQTRSRELAASVSNPRTIDQMNQRVKWGNLVNFYRANRGWMKFAYETKKENQSEYNKFMSLNVTASQIYLPKTIAAGGGCIVNDYIMTQGSLPSIECIDYGSGWKTNIVLQNTDEWDATLTVGEFSRNVLENNPAIREGDQLSFVRFTQQTNSTTGVPFIIVRKYEIIINSNDVRRYADFMPLDYVGWDESANEEWLAVFNSGNAGGFCMILSRTIGGKTYVSTQKIVVANNAAMIQAYSSSAAFQAAVDSYGESTEPFLTSTTASTDENAPILPSIVSVKIGTVTKVPGEQWYPVGDLSSKTIEVVFSEVMAGSNPGLQLSLLKGAEAPDISIDNVTLSNNKLTATLPSGLNTYADYAMANIRADIGDNAYRAVFPIPNAATIEGLE